MKSTRKLAAIMFTDIVGYSHTMSLDETRGLALLEAHNDILTRRIAEFDGKVLKKMGDAVFAEFPTAIDAVNCAIEIQTELKEFNEGKDIDDQILLRIGIHIGDVIVHGDDLFGEGINIAARLETMADPGGICMSQAVNQSVRSQANINPVLVGELKLKNILEKHTIYKIPKFYAEDYLVENPIIEDELDSINYKIKSIKELPPPSRSPLTVGITSFILSIIYLMICIYIGISWITAESKYKFWINDLLDSKNIVLKLQDTEDANIAQIRSLISTRLIRLVGEFQESDTSSIPAVVSINQKKILLYELNRLLESRKPILNKEGLNQLDLPNDIRKLISENPDDGKLKLVNRRLIEHVFQNEIEKWGSENYNIARRFQMLSIEWSIGSTLYEVTLYSVLGIVLIVFMSMRTVSLRTLRIEFEEVKNITHILEYFFTQLGFKPPVKSVNTLTFKAKPSTIITKNALTVTARLDGNRVIITGTYALIRLFQKQLLSFSSEE
ncbi:MAG: adenylate/guanylate cyclase domain-containing protein [Calditrichaeota bacterium]|nr:adenylate/guanylate cyclase domain-containing protein [Calditrichota bacterium]